MESIGDYTSGNSLAGMEQPLYGIRAARAQIDQRAALGASRHISVGGAQPFTIRYMHAASDRHDDTAANPNRKTPCSQGPTARTGGASSRGAAGRSA